MHDFKMKTPIALSTLIAIETAVVSQSFNLAHGMGTFAGINLAVGINLALLTLAWIFRRTGAFLLTGLVYAGIVAAIHAAELALGRAIDGVDIFLTMNSNLREIWEFAAGHGVPTWFVAFGCLFALAAYSSEKIDAKGQSRSSRMVGVAMVLFIGSYALSGFTGVAYALTEVALNVSKAVYLKQTDYSQRDGFSFHADKTDNPKADVVILVIGESARYDRFGINGYRRNTTPELSKIRNLVTFSDISADGNCTFTSVPMLVTRATPRNFFRAFIEGSVAEMFREAGYYTAWLSVQGPDAYKPDADLVYFPDPWPKPQADGTPWKAERTTDDYLLALAEKLLSERKGGKLLIILHTLGSHYSYERRYDMAKFGKFTPTLRNAANGGDSIHKDILRGMFPEATKEQLDNSYDNSILHTDYILSRVMNDLEKDGRRGLVLYVSDHAEDLWDENKDYHCGPVLSKFTQHVPMFVFGTSGFVSENPTGWRNMLANKDKAASHSNVFHTLAGLAGISYPEQNESLDLSNFRFKETHRYALGMERQLVKLQDGVKVSDMQSVRP